ncbi:MAG: addiction module protein [Planctomycetes bacterium]|nr:addiction module protein [Planctomycetota bacterium]
MSVIEIPELARLSTPEKILLLEELWDTIASDEASVPVPQSHRDELDRRLARHRAHPGNLLSLEELQDRISRGR